MRFGGVIDYREKYQPRNLVLLKDCEAEFGRNLGYLNVVMYRDNHPLTVSVGIPFLKGSPTRIYYCEGCKLIPTLPLKICESEEQKTLIKNKKKQYDKKALLKHFAECNTAKALWFHISERGRCTRRHQGYQRRKSLLRKLGRVPTVDDDPNVADDG